MADHKMDPWYRAIRHNMESIIRCVEYKRVKYKLIESELIEIEDLEEYDKLSTNSDAVSKIVMKVMCCIDDCETFVKILQDMPQRRYKKLTKQIIEKYEEYSRDAMHHIDSVAIILQQAECSTTDQHRISPSTADGPLEESQRMVESLLTQDIATTRINHVIGLKKIAGKSFAEVLMKIIRMFRKAINESKVSFEKPVGQSILLQLNECSMNLHNAHHVICSTEEGTKIFKNSVASVITHATRVSIVIKKIPKVNWLNLHESAETIGMLMCMFQKITEMVSSIQEVDSEPLQHLFDNIADLNASLADIKRLYCLAQKS